MITVKELTKRYGAHTAVDALSFTVDKGQIYGLLGPNGAGKSTTMNIITGYISATDGTAEIDGCDIFDSPAEARAKIGYLPEQPPLYTDMTPREYLAFAAELKGLPREQRKAAVEQWLKQYPTIKVVLDVHRDALVGNEGEIYKLVSEEAGEKVAQVMMVIGSDENSGAHPRWQDNLAFAVLLQKGLVRGYTSLARPIVLRSSSYNQQVSPGSILVEVGGHGNTLTEAINGARMWADNVARTLQTLKTGQG